MVTVPIMVVVIVIGVVIRQRAPAHITVSYVHQHQCRRPPTASPPVITIRRPRPSSVVIDPAAVMIRRPAPRFVVHPNPAVRRNPAPLAVTIRRPVRICTDGG